MINLVLDNLSRPAGKGFKTGLELLILVLDLDGLPPLCLADTKQGQASLLRIIAVGTLDDLRVEHHHVAAFVIKSNDPLGEYSA